MNCAALGGADEVSAAKGSSLFSGLPRERFFEASVAFPLESAANV